MTPRYFDSAGGANTSIALETAARAYVMENGSMDLSRTGLRPFARPACTKAYFEVDISIWLAIARPYSQAEQTTPLVEAGDFRLEAASCQIQTVWKTKIGAVRRWVFRTATLDMHDSKKYPVRLRRWNLWMGRQFYPAVPMPGILQL